MMIELYAVALAISNFTVGFNSDGYAIRDPQKNYDPRIETIVDCRTDRECQNLRFFYAAAVLPHIAICELNNRFDLVCFAPGGQQHGTNSYNHSDP